MNRPCRLSRKGEPSVDDLATRLTIDTMSGAAAMLQDTGRDAGALKAAVRSPADTTDAALRRFEKDDTLDHLVLDAIRVAHERARERGGNSQERGD